MIVLNKFLSIKDFINLVKETSPFEIHKSVQSETEKSFEFLKKFSQDKIIYGVNTGFGPMAQYRVSEEDRIQLQYNLIRSHSTGVGKMLSTSFVRAAMLARLNSLMKAKSGVHPSVFEVLTKLLNKEIYPVIFEHGGVGASGDLVQLAHIALVLIGEGEVIYKGERRNTKEVFEKENITPIKVTLREGLALMNGTSVMTGIGIINYSKANKLVDWSLKCSSMINELVEAYDDHFSQELNEVKLHAGQAHVAEKMRIHLKDSKLTRKREQHLYSGKVNDSIFKEKVQEYYSIRCVPQILGPIYDTVLQVGKVLEDELNSANDNPIIDSEREQVYHGGNFHGDYISLEMDKLKLVVTKLTMLAERQLNFLLNSKINGILPPFVNRGVLGLNYGVQGAQFTATSTTAESQMLSNSMYVHSIPCNNDNQDIVSMGTNAAQITDKVIENAFEVISIELITIVQAIGHLGVNDKLSSESKIIFDKLNSFIPDIVEDKPLYSMIEETKQFLIKND
ncbi:MAG: aromatic amino acid ammonia-lyase [Brumimicrobium sp.]